MSWLGKFRLAIEKSDPGSISMEEKASLEVVGKLEGKMLKLFALHMTLSSYEESSVDLFDQLKTHLWVAGLFPDKVDHIPSDIAVRLFSLIQQSETTSLIFATSVMEAFNLWGDEEFGIRAGFEVETKRYQSQKNRPNFRRKKNNDKFWLEDFCSLVDRTEIPKNFQPPTKRDPKDIFCGIASDHLKRLYIITLDYQNRRTEALSKFTLAKKGPDDYENNPHFPEVARANMEFDTVLSILQSSVMYEFNMWTKSNFYILEGWQIVERPDKVEKMDKHELDNLSSLIVQ